MGDNGGDVWVEADREGGDEGEVMEGATTGAANNFILGSAN